MQAKREACDYRPLCDVGRRENSHHAVITFTNTPFSEFLMTSPDCSTMRPQFDPILLNEPVPVNGRIHKSVLDKPGFGVELNRDCNLKRPYSH